MRSGRPNEVVNHLRRMSPSPLDLGGVNPVNRHAHPRSPRLRKVVRRAGALASAQSTVITFISNTGLTGATDLIVGSTGATLAQGFIAGGSGEYVVLGVDIRSGGTAKFDLSLWSANASGIPTRHLAYLVPPSTFSSGSLSFSAPPGLILNAANRYVVVVVASGGARLKEI